MKESSKKYTFQSPNLIDILCYPKFTTKEYVEKLDEIRLLNLRFAILEGTTLLNNINILGKGTEGLVVKVQTYNNENLALKIRRTDSCRINMKNEFDLYHFVNENNIGPKVYHVTKHLLLMEYAEGLPAIDWFMKKKLDALTIKHVIINILNQCYMLDKMNVDHGQLNKLNNHVIISDDASKCTIVDFETASRSRKVTNLTSAIQGLIFNGYISTQINKHIDYTNKKNEFLKVLKLYKNEKSQENFDSVIALV